MEHIAALLLVVGCSGDLRQCEELPAPVPVYEAVEECTGELESVLKYLERARPKVFARCLAIDPATEEEDMELTWDVTPAGELVAEIGVPNLVIAASGQTSAQQ